MNSALKFLAKLLLFSVILFLGKDILTFVYQFCLLGSCYLMGMRFSADSFPYESSIRMIPFIALVLATPRLGAKKRATIVALGFVAFLIMDLTSILIWKTPPSRTEISGPNAHLLYSLIWELCGHWILPFVIWIVAAQKEIISLLGGILPVPQTGPASRD